MNTIQILAVCGMLSPVVYTGMWIIGGRLRASYSHIRDDISSLFAIGAPNKALIQMLAALSSVLLLLLYIGVFIELNESHALTLGPMTLVASGFLGVLVPLFFPLDEGGEITTYRGKMHLALVMASGLLTIAGMLILWLQLRDTQELEAFAVFSVLNAVSALMLFIIAGIFITSRYRGLLERIAVTPFQVYYFVLAIFIFMNG